MEEDARTYLSLRIACLENPDQLYQYADKVLEYINEVIGYQPERPRRQNKRLF